MRILIRSNDQVLLSYVEALLRQGSIGSMLLDTHMSATEGSLGLLPRRLTVAADDWNDAARLLREAGLGQWIETDG